MSTFDRVLSWVEDFLAASTLAAAAALAIVAVILRYVFDHVIFWSSEAVIYLVIFSTYMGAVITLRHNEHVNIDILPFLFGRRGKRAFTVLGSLVTLIYCGVIGSYAWILVTEPAIRNTVTPALDLPLWVVYLGLPVGLTLMFVRALEIVYRAARGREAFAEVEGSAYGEETPE